MPSHFGHNQITVSTSGDVDSKRQSASCSSVPQMQFDSGRAQVDDWVAAPFNDRWYPGQVTGIDGLYSIVKFMVPFGRKRTTDFCWPLTLDEQRLHLILFVSLPPPIPVSSSLRAYRWSEDVIKNVEQQLCDI